MIMHETSGNKWKKRVCKWIASLLAVALLVNQSCFSVLAEEIREETEADSVTVTDEETGNFGADEKTEDSDADEDVNTDTNTISDVNSEDEGNVFFQNDETEIVVRKDAATPATVENTFAHDKFTFQITDENNLEVEVTGHEDGTDVAGALEIPSAAWNGDDQYTVVSIGNKAFYNCSNLTSITIPDSVTSIGSAAFENCSNLTSITIPDSVTSIGGAAFYDCYSLKSIVIPNNVTSIKSITFRHCRSLTNVIIPNSVISIGSTAFGECYSLESITIPDSVTSIGSCAFELCHNLTNIIIPRSVTNIGSNAFHLCNSLESVTILNDNIYIDKYAFSSCYLLNSFRIALSENITGTPNVVVYYGFDSFWGCPDDRSLTFLTQDGTTVLSSSTTPTLAKAVEVYDAVDDGGINDGYWYDWKLPDVSDIPDVTYYPVTINVKIDDSAWSDCEKTFALSADHNTFITDLDAIPVGSYTIYDTTGVEDSAGYVNTNVTVEVKDAAAQAEVNYYTVTFYNDDTIISEQIVPRNAKVSAPSTTPQKDGHTFYRWATSKDGSTEFDFNSLVTARTDIYASWIADTEELFTITASAATGGSVTPSGKVKVKSCDSQQFTITPEDGYRISSILADGREVLSSEQAIYDSQVKSTNTGNNTKYYVFENVTDDHTLAVYFEPINTGGNNDTDDTGDSDNGNYNGSDDTGSNNPVAIFDPSVTSSSDIVSNNTTASTPKNNEPKTGYDYHIEIYATIAMIAGLSYLLLYFTDGKNGMTEDEKKEIIASLVKWAQKGKRLRRFAALAIIFLILVYYHSMGKRTSVEWKAVYEK